MLVHRTATKLALLVALWTAPGLAAPKERPDPGAPDRPSARIARGVPSVFPVARPGTAATTHRGTAVLTRPPAVTATGAPARTLAGPLQIATFPRDGDTRVSVNATLYIVFDQPTNKSGIFSVADLDSGPSGTLLNLDAPRWSALGDTVFLKPSAPMIPGHLHGMRVNLIFSADGSEASSDLPIVLFTVFPRTRLELIPSGIDFSSVTLVPGVPFPVPIQLAERNDNTATLSSARFELFASPGVMPGIAPIHAATVPLHAIVPRRGTARITVPVLLPVNVARTAPPTLGLRILLQGFDETGEPVLFEAFSAVTRTSPTDSLLTLAPALVVPEIASNVAVRSIVLEEPLPGAFVAAGDTVRARAVVTGIGTGTFRVVFFLDGDAVAIEEGFMESGHPVTVEPRGPLMTRRLGEHVLHVVVEHPQEIAARPVTFLCVPRPAGIAEPVRAGMEADTAEAAAPRKPSRFTLGGTYLLTGKTEFRDEEAAGLAWSAWRARFEISGSTALEATSTWRLRGDDPENGTVEPEQLQVRLGASRGSVEWGDLAPGLARDAPLLASPVPRRAAQGAWRGTPAGDLEGYVALESRPRSSAGTIDETRSDLYAARLTRAFAGDRFRAALYGGYAHDDPTPAGADSAVRASAVYGGSGTLRFAGDWTLLADVATVRHREIAGVEPGRSRTALRGALAGEVAGFAARAEGFRYQPDLVTSLNPYAISNRRGGSAELARDLANWRFFGSFRREEPEEENGAPSIRVDRWTFGGRLKLNALSWVTPAFVRIQHQGPNTSFRESRAATELVVGEPYEGQTRGRIDLALFEDERGENARRLVTSGSLVSTRRHPGRVTSTISGGVEIEEHQDLDLTDQTVQAALEIRWEAVPGKLLITPLLAYLDRELDTITRREERFTARLQLAWVRVPGLGENAIALEGRIDRLDLQDPIEDESVEGSVHLSLGQRFDLTR